MYAFCETWVTVENLKYKHVKVLSVEYTNEYVVKVSSGKYFDSMNHRLESRKHVPMHDRYKVIIFESDGCVIPMAFVKEIADRGKIARPMFFHLDKAKKRNVQTFKLFPMDREFYAACTSFKIAHPKS